MTEMNSEIIPFFNGKTIFLTGATGFVGKLLIDQLLRKCEPKKLYLLIRPKKGVESKERIEELFQQGIYERLRNEKSDIFKKVEVINGDLSGENLDLTEESRTKLIENVDIVIHGAATVKFDEIINKATAINVKGTISIIKLCHQIKNLNAFVYISTAYSNCPYGDIKEEFYDPPISCNELLKLIEKFNDDELQHMTPRLLGKWPNTYSFTKAVAENAVNTYCKGLPVCVFRPAIIVGTNNEPFPGWIDNIYGPTGVVAGAAAGVIRVIKVDPECFACVIPGDMVAFAILAATYKTSQIGPTNEIPIYNYVTDKENLLKWSSFMDFCTNIGANMPVLKSVWTHSLRLEPNRILFAIFSFFLHFLPALLIDIVLFTSNKPRRALKVSKKIVKFLNVIAYFSTKTWNFSNNNVQALWSGLNKEDKRLFNFDMKSLDWEDYFLKAIPGVRLYIFQETPDTIPMAQIKRKRQQMIENTIITFLFGFIAWIIWKYTSSIVTPLFT